MESAKRMSAWVFRTFKTREKLPPLITLYKSLIQPLVEYASALWSPIDKGSIEALEKVQKSFVKRIKNVSRDYEIALKQLNLYTLQRRRERYQILHIWKMLENLAPNKSKTSQNIIETQSNIHDRRGKTCKTHI